ncbi:MAG: STAS-like domain-containing protein [Bacteroidota bacterium]
MIVNVQSVVGPICVTLDDGEEVHRRILPQLLNGNRVHLDFLGVQIVAAPFLNAAVGRLLKEIRPERFNRLLNVSNLDNVGQSVLKRVIENSMEYYSNTTLRVAVDEVLSEEAEP